MYKENLALNNLQRLICPINKPNQTKHTHTYTHTCIYTFILTYTHIYTYTHIRAYIHIHTVTIFPFVVDRGTYLILAGENNHYGGISLDEKKISRVVTQPRTPLERIKDLNIFIFTNPSARAGYDTRSIYKRSLTGLNSAFSFS